MPHQCVRCGKLHEDGSKELLKGCDCGSKFFFFIKKEEVEEAKKIAEDLSVEDREQIEKDVMDIVGTNFNNKETVFLDIESIKILRPGKYELDLVDLFRWKPLVYKLEDGKYIIDLVSTFEAKEKVVD